MSPGRDRGPRARRPDDPTWRADALAGSRHSRLADELAAPPEAADPERAREVCAAAARLALQDFAPALLLAPAAERRRAQTLAAWALTLFDFARQTGLEGERLAQINRWQFELEAALDGRPAGQPVFLQMADEERRRPWSRAAFDRLVEAARRRVTVARPRSAAEAEERSEALGGALAEALLGARPPRSALLLAAALLRLQALQSLGDALRRHAVQLPADELPLAGEPADPGLLDAAVERECGRLGALLAETSSRLATERRELGPWRPAVAYLLGAGQRLRDRIAALGGRVAAHPPRLGLGARLALLLRARLSRR